MKTFIIYRVESDHARQVIDFLRDFERQTGKKIEEIDPDQRINEGFLIAHDIVEYPTIISLTDDGQELKMWRGTPLPQIDEVSYYV